MSNYLVGQSLEIGTGFGITTYDGDLSPPKHLTRIYYLEPALSVFAKYNYNRYFSARLSFLATAVRGEDAKSRSEWRELRNLSFHTPIFEVSLIGEINLLGFHPDKSGRSFSPYLFGGVAYFRFDPTTLYNGEVVRLQPLGTEGQGLPQFPDRPFYSLNQISIPVGGGLKWAVTDRITLSGEIGWRKTFTDYLDDVSTTYVSYDLLFRERGETTARLSRRSWERLGIAPEEYRPRPYEVSQRGRPAKDWYITGLIKVSYQIYMDDITSTNLKCKF
jgi:hypothetical protein